MYGKSFVCGVGRIKVAFASSVLKLCLVSLGSSQNPETLVSGCGGWGKNPSDAQAATLHLPQADPCPLGL